MRIAGVGLGSCSWRWMRPWSAWWTPRGPAGGVDGADHSDDVRLGLAAAAGSAVCSSDQVTDDGGAGSTIRRQRAPVAIVKHPSDSVAGPSAPARRW